jgi:orotidine-5'-phosphate decarboxylase
MTGLCVALDTRDVDEACRWARDVAPSAQMVKLGLSFYAANGNPGVIEVMQAVPGLKLFLDLKLHDTPTQVAETVAGLLYLSPDVLTVHASGGAPMINAAVRAAPNVAIAAVTVLTSLPVDERNQLSQIGVMTTRRLQVLRLAKLALDTGALAIVCSGHEVADVRRMFGSEMAIMVPGIRYQGAPDDDHIVTMTPQQVVDAGADWMIVGHPITGAHDRGLAAKRMSDTANQIIQATEGSDK